MENATLKISMFSCAKFGFAAAFGGTIGYALAAYCIQKCTAKLTEEDLKASTKKSKDIIDKIKDTFKSDKEEK